MHNRRVFVGAVITFILYIFGVSGLMCLMDDWSFMDSVYFLFTSVALIGALIDFTVGEI